MTNVICTASFSRTTTGTTNETPESIAESLRQSETKARNPFTLSTLATAIDNTMGNGFTKLLEATNKFKLITSDEIGKYLGDGAKFSIVERDRTNIDTAKRRLTKFIDEYVAGRVKPEYTQQLGDTPTVLQYLGAKPLKMQIDGATVEKVLDGKHRYFITADMLKELPEHLYNPLAVFRDGDSAKIVLTELKDKINGSSIIVAVHLKKMAGGVVAINDIASVYGADAYSANKKLTAENIEYYRNEKSLEQSTVRHPNTPLVDTVQSAQDLGRTIATEADVVNKFGAKFSKSSQTDGKNGKSDANNPDIRYSKDGRILSV